MSHLIHLHLTSIHICYSNIQPSVLSVALALALATDQRSSNGCYNCSGQAGPYQPAVKMVTNIYSIQIPYWGVVFCVDTLLHKYFCNFYPSIKPTFYPHIDSKRVCTLIKHSVTISSVQYTLSIIALFFEEMFSQRRNFYENNIILWYYQIRPKVVWKVHGP